MISYVALSQDYQVKIRYENIHILTCQAKRKSRLRFHHFICFSTTHRHTLIMEKEGGEIDGSGDQALTCKK